MYKNCFQTHAVLDLGHSHVTVDGQYDVSGVGVFVHLHKYKPTSHSVCDSCDSLHQKPISNKTSLSLNYIGLDQ